MAPLASHKLIKPAEVCGRGVSAAFFIFRPSSGTASAAPSNPGPNSLAKVATARFITLGGPALARPLMMYVLAVVGNSSSGGVSGGGGGSSNRASSPVHTRSHLPASLPYLSIPKNDFCLFCDGEILADLARALCGAKTPASDRALRRVTSRRAAYVIPPVSCC